MRPGGAVPGEKIILVVTVVLAACTAFACTVVPPAPPEFENHWYNDSPFVLSTSYLIDSLSAAGSRLFVIIFFVLLQTQQLCGSQMNILFFGYGTDLIVFCFVADSTIYAWACMFRVFI